MRVGHPACHRLRARFNLPRKFRPLLAHERQHDQNPDHGSQFQQPSNHKLDSLHLGTARQVRSMAPQTLSLTHTANLKPARKDGRLDANTMWARLRCVAPRPAPQVAANAGIAALYVVMGFVVTGLASLACCLWAILSSSAAHRRPTSAFPTRQCLASNVSCWAWTTCRAKSLRRYFFAPLSGCAGDVRSIMVNCLPRTKSAELTAAPRWLR